MKVLFSVRNAAYVRHYESVIRLLAARGHTIHVVADGSHRRERWPDHARALTADTPNVTLGVTPSLSADPWYELATAVRQNLFHQQFLEQEYTHAPVLRSRAAEKAPGFARGLVEGPLGRSARFRRTLERVLESVERSVPVPPRLIAYLQAQRPDVVVLSPLIVLKTVQLDLLRAARQLGIPTVFGVASWDHLSSKGRLRDNPDRVLVWNATQRDEAVRLHRVPSERIVITGAQVFDEWFEREPSTTRSDFCRLAGLRGDGRFILYVGSALFERSPNEAAFVERWLEALRSRPGLANVSVMVRPHFKRAEEWQNLAQRAPRDLVVWPAAGEVPVDDRSRAAYFDSLYHAAAIVGLNTSALIEAAILSKPVLTVLLPEFYDNQEGTIHFRYLLDAATPLLHSARSLEAHAMELESVVCGHDPDPERSARFVGTFVRPFGTDQSATRRVVDAIESAAGLRPERVAHAYGWPEFVLRPLSRAAVTRVESQRAARLRIKQQRREQKDSERAASSR